ncbi:MAG: DUF4113 domain-containing protein [Spirochaetales bacterium]|nr:DUF4113 domain-containing protein [Candidatus Physcosoma equi]
MTGLCDCNSFFASSEKVFRPDLKDRPVVVLSNNDGIVVALVGKAKELGLTRGDAWFQVENYAKANGVVAFSSNYTLYQDLSDRVMNMLSSLSPAIEPYSIDEAFFTLSPDHSPEEVRRIITQSTGVPVSIGIGRTKTLAKIASKKAKKARSGAFLLDTKNEDSILGEFPVEDVWGVGWSWGKKLPKLGIRTAKALREVDEAFVKRHFNVCLQRTIDELNGIEAHKEGDQNISIQSGISFSEPIFKIEDMTTALILQAQTMAAKLTEKKLMAKPLGINFATSRFSDDWRSPYGAVRLRHASNYTPDFSEAIEFLVPQLFEEGARYKNCHVFGYDLVSEEDREPEFFENPYLIQKETAVAHVVGEITKHYGRNTLQTAASYGKDKSDLMRREKKSPYYTTRFSELAEVY